MFALRRSAAFLRTSAPAARALHSSPSVAKKAKHAAVEEDVEMELDDDLFGGVESSASAASDRAARRGQLANVILAKEAIRVGELRKVIQLSDTPADLESLDPVLRAWRVAGNRVTNQTAEELVGRCINLGRPDLAQKYASDRLTYGVPQLAPNMEAKLQKSLEA